MYIATVYCIIFIKNEIQSNISILFLKLTSTTYEPKRDKESAKFALLLIGFDVDFNNRSKG